MKNLKSEPTHADVTREGPAFEMVRALRLLSTLPLGRSVTLVSYWPLTLYREAFLHTASWLLC